MKTKRELKEMFDKSYQLNSDYLGDVHIIDINNSVNMVLNALLYFEDLDILSIGVSEDRCIYTVSTFENLTINLDVFFDKDNHNSSGYLLNIIRDKKVICSHSFDNIAWVMLKIIEYMLT
jgi:hypothetical protein